MDMMKRLVLAVCALACFVGRSFADVDQEGENLRFSVEVTGEYTDNRDASEDEESNFDLLLSPRLDAVMQWGGRIVLDFFYDPIYRYRSDPSDIQNETQLFHDLGISYDHQLTRPLKFRLREHLNITDDPSIQEGGTTLRRDSSFVLNRAQVGINHAFSRRSNIDVEVNSSMKRYEELERRRESDQDTMDATVALWRQTSRTGGWIVSGSVGSVGYYRSAEVDRDYTTVGGAIGLRKVWSSQLQGDARVGLSQLEYDNDEFDSSSLPTVSVSGKYTPVPTMRLSGSLVWSARESDVYPFASQEYMGASFGLGWDATKRVTLGGSISYRAGQYELDVLDSDAASYQTARGFDLEGDENALVATAEMAYKLGNELSVTLVQRHEDVDSDVSFSYDRNSTRIGLSKRF